MISVQQATEIILNNAIDWGNEEIYLFEADGRVLAETWVADRDFPPFDRVTMDGIAIRYDDFEKGINAFEISDIQAAGMAQKTWAGTGTCLEAMTGAILPEGTDTIIRYEDLTIADKTATINVSNIRPQQNVHFQGSDRPKDSLILEKNKVIGPAEMAIAATLGKALVKVKKLPKVVVISSGDELVSVIDTPLPHQIRRSNNFAIASVLKKYQIKADSLHIKDEEKEVNAIIEKALQDYDVLILSGGVSMGKFDLIPQALADLGVEKLFHKIKQRPGKPFWFGRKKEDKIVFALPGNPVSSFMCTNRYVVSWLRACLGLNAFENHYATLSEEVYFKPALQYFLPVQLSFDETGKQWAKPMKGNGSGDHANLVNADAFIELPLEKDVFEKGESYRIFKFR